MTATAKALARVKKPKWTKSEIQWTTEYDVFRRMKGNRPLDEKHVEKIMEAMQQRDLEVPIQINQEFEVIDGQHTLEARQRLGLPIPFVGMEEGDLEAVQKLNANRKSWTIENYTDSYIERGKKDYATYKWFRQTYNLPHQHSIQLLMGSVEGDGSIKRNWVSETFNSGKLKVTNLEEAKKFAGQIKKFETFFPHWNSKTFVSAMQFCMKKKVFNVNRFYEKATQYQWLMIQCPTTVAYVEMIERVVNYRSKNKVSLRYGS